MRYQDGQLCYDDRPEPCEQVHNIEGAALGSCGLQVEVVMQEPRIKEWNCNACFERAANALRGLEDDGFDRKFSWPRR